MLKQSNLLNHLNLLDKRDNDFALKPINDIKIKQLYIMGTNEWNPKKKSVINIQNNGINNAKRLLVKLKPVNSAMPVIGAKFGGCGKNLVNKASTTKPKTILISSLFNVILFFVNLYNLYYLVKYIFLLEYKS